MTSTTPPEGLRPDSFQPGNWRLQLAEDLAEGPLPPYLAPLADDTVHAAAAALVDNSADGPVSAAVALANGSSLDGAEIEGRVIAGQTDAEIAAAIKFPAETVAAYVALCFDIRYLLSNRSLLRSIAAGGIATLAPTQADMIRWAGFCRGEQFVGRVAEYFRLGLGDGRRITPNSARDPEACKEFRVVRRWLSTIRPISDPAAIVCRIMACRKKEFHELRRAGEGKWGS